MRILHVIIHTRHMNGHVHSTVDLACAQVSLGHDVTICGGEGDFDDTLERNGVGRIVVEQDRRLHRLPASVTRLSRIITGHAPDVVHAHMVASALLAWPGCKLAGTPMVTTVHNAFERSAPLMGIGARVIAVSESTRRGMQRRGIPRSRLRTVLNGTIGSARFRAKPIAHALQGPSIVFVGGLHPRKGLTDLIEAFSIVVGQVSGATLHVVGDGPHRELHESEAIAAGLAQAVTFHGAVSDPRPFLLGCDVVALPSRADPAPLVISEAREAGCAIVASAVDGVPELLEDGRAGILVPPRDAPRLAKAILSLIGDETRLATWRSRSQIRIDRMSLRRVAGDMLDVYSEYLPHHSSPSASAHAANGGTPARATASRREPLGQVGG